MNITINQLDEKPQPEAGDELEIQEAGGGQSRKTTVGAIVAHPFIAHAIGQAIAAAVVDSLASDDPTAPLSAAQGQVLAGMITGLSQALTNLTPGDIGAAPAVHQHPAGQVNGLAPVATTGDYADLIGQPVIPDRPEDIGAAPETHQHHAGDIDGLTQVAITGDYADLTGQPDIPSTAADIGAAPASHTHTADQAGADPVGTAEAAISTHVAAADPHPQYTTSAEAAAAAPVQSVAGKTGAVTLTAADVGAQPAGTSPATLTQNLAGNGYNATGLGRLEASTYAAPSTFTFHANALSTQGGVGASTIWPLLLGAWGDCFQGSTISLSDYWDGSNWVDNSDQVAAMAALFDGRPDTNYVCPKTKKKFRIVFLTPAANTFAGILSIYEEWQSGGPKPYTWTLERGGAAAGPWTLVASGSVLANEYFSQTQINSHSPQRYYRITIDVADYAESVSLWFQWIRCFNSRLGFTRYLGMPFTWNRNEILPDGDIRFVTGKGSILTAANGTKYRLKVNNDGTLTTELV